MIIGAEKQAGMGILWNGIYSRTAGWRCECMDLEMIALRGIGHMHARGVSIRTSALLFFFNY